MTEVVSKIKRLRTFSGDVMNARGVLSVPDTTTPPTKFVLKKPEPTVTRIPPQPVTVSTPPSLSPKPVTPPLKVTPAIETLVRPVAPVTVVEKPEPIAKMGAPAFAPHIIKDELSVLSKPVPSSILDTPSNRLDVMEAENSIDVGSIISDRKNKRFNVFSATWEAMKEWFVSERLQFEKRQDEKEAAIPKVRPVESRKEVVAKAASQSALAPKDDHKNVLVRQQTELDKKTAAAAPVIAIKSSASVPAPSWSHFTGETPLETAAPTSTVVETTTEPITAIQAPVEIPVVVKEPEVVSVPVPVVEVIPKEEIPSPIKEAPVEAPIAVPSYAPVEEMVEEPATTSANVVAEEEVFTPEPKPISRTPTRFATPTRTPFPIVRVGIIGVMSIVLGVSASLWLFGGGAETNQEIAAQDDTISLIAADQKVDVPVSNDRTEFLSALTKVSVPAENAVSLLQPKINLSGTVSTPPTATILQILNLQLPGSFTRSIETINFGRYDGRFFIALRVTSFEAGFSGLLSGESLLITDLYPLFGTPVTGTFDPSARTAGGVVEPFFVDSTVKNHDVRILRDELQKERLVYGFVNRNTVIIATDSAVFAAAAEKIK